MADDDEPCCCCLTVTMTNLWAETTASCQTELLGHLRTRQQSYGPHPRNVVFESSGEEGGQLFRILNLHPSLTAVVWSAVSDPGMQCESPPFELRGKALTVGAYGGVNRCVNLRTFELWVRPNAWRRHVEKYGAAPCEPALCRAVASHCRNVRLNASLATFDGVPPPSEQQCAVPLMHHQKIAVAWMRRTEDDLAHRRLPLHSDPTTRLPHTGQKVHFHLRRFVPDMPETDATSLDALQLHPRGYVLAEPPGSGKTATVIELIAATAPTASPERLETHATLVIVPNHLCRQWAAEFRRFAPQLNLTCLFDARQGKATTYADLMRADAVLTTFGYLTSPAYAKAHHERLRGLTSMHDPTVDCARRALALQVARQPGCLETTCLPTLALLRWSRVCVDEVHELATQHVPATRPHPLQTLVTDVWVGISGTPPVHCAAQLRTLSPMLLPDTLPQEWLDTVWTPPFCEEVVARLVFESGQCATTRPVRHRVHHVAQTAREQDVLGMRSHSGIDTLVQVASYFNVLHAVDEHDTGFATLKPLEDIVVDVRNEFEVQQRNLEASAESKARDRAQAEAEVAVLEACPETGETQVLLRVKRAQVTRLCKAVQDDRDTMDRLRRSFEYFRRSAADHSAASECPICYENASDTILRCGHTFCKACIQMCLSNKSECPVCKTLTVSRHVHCIEPEASPERDDARNLYGSKFCEVVRQLEQIRDAGESAIVFAQWAPLLRCLQSVLRECGLRCATVRGNTSARTSAARKLDTGEVDVLLLTSETCAGLNLTSASHVVWLHAPTGSEQDALKTMVDQSVARCNRLGQTRDVTVHWFVAEATVEQTAFEKFWTAYDTRQ